MAIVFPQLETWINSVDLNSIASELSGLFKNWTYWNARFNC